MEIFCVAGEMSMKLHEFLEIHGILQTKFAQRLGISQGYLCEILSTGKGMKNPRFRRPSPELAFKIVHATGGQVTLEEVLFPNKKSCEQGGYVLGCDD